MACPPPRRPVTSASADQPSTASSRSYPAHCPSSLAGIMEQRTSEPRFGTVRPTIEDMAAFIAETPLLRECDPKTGLVLWAIAIEAVKHENSALLVELDAPATTQM